MSRYVGEARVTRTGELVGRRFGFYPTAREVWAQHREDRRKHEDEHEGWGLGEYSDTVRDLDYAATECEFGSPHEDWPLAADGTGEILGTTPGLGDGPWDAEVDDPGLTYAVLLDKP